MRYVAALILVSLVGGGLYYISVSSTATPTESFIKVEEVGTAGSAITDEMERGQYIPYSQDAIKLAETGDVVLFFRASWCPTCRGVDADIKAHLKDIPKGVTILDVNYDDSSALKAKYGVTYQHTFVQVAADGTQLAKWQGSPTLAALLGNIK